MTIEAIKAEIEQLEPKAEAAWEELERAKKELAPAQNRWFELNQRIEQLRSALSILDPKPKEPEKLLV